MCERAFRSVSVVVAQTFVRCVSFVATKRRQSPLPAYRLLFCTLDYFALIGLLFLTGGAALRSDYGAADRRRRHEPPISCNCNRIPDYIYRILCDYVFQPIGPRLVALIMSALIYDEHLGRTASTDIRYVGRGWFIFVVDYIAALPRPRY